MSLCRAFIIVAPASSGSRFITRQFLEAGCLGSDGFEQSFDNQLPDAKCDIVWKTHNISNANGQTKPLLYMAQQAIAHGYQPVLILVHRDAHCVASSANKRGYPGGYKRLLKQNTVFYELLYQEIAKLSLSKYTVSYDMLVQYPNQYLAQFGRNIKLQFSKNIYAVNENAKHYGATIMTDSHGNTLLNVVKSGIPFVVRENTVDINVLDEVITGDCYKLNQIKLRKEPNIVDVGAHIGSFTKLCAWKWPHGNFYAYEANSRNWPILEQNLQEIRHRVVLYHGALVGSEPVNKRLVINAADAERVTGGWGIVYSDASSQPAANDAAVDIENFFYTKDLFPILDKVDILKLDCEGSEFSIIHAMTDAELYKVDYLVAEIHCGALQHSPITYTDFRSRILSQFICPVLDAKPRYQPHDLFNIVACNRKLLPK